MRCTPAAFGGRGEGLRRGAVAPLERRVRAEGVDQVVGDVHALAARAAPRSASVASATAISTSSDHGRSLSFPGSRAMHRTAYPALSSSGTSRPPMYPDAPVTRQRSEVESCSTQSSGPGDALFTGWPPGHRLIIVANTGQGG